MSTNTIITIERQYGSGGHLIGEKLAESLGIPFYDSELIKLLQRKVAFVKRSLKVLMKNQRLVFFTLW